MFITVGRGKKADRVSALLARHLGKVGMNDLTIAERQFPIRVRADLHRAVEHLFGGERPGPLGSLKRFCGVRKDNAFAGVTLADLLTDGWYGAATIAPPEYEEIDVGEEHPVRALKVGLWLLEQAGERYAVFLAPAVSCGVASGVRCQVASAKNEKAAPLADAFFRAIETAVREARCYRGKILSLEQGQAYTGQSTGIRVHRLAKVERNHVILPERTLALLDRNVVQFIGRRAILAAAGQSTRKGLLFYGRPGTGKSHTIRYLAGKLEGHTTLLVTSEQVTLLDEYMALARLLQPSIVVIEDADLIARDRAQMHSPGEEILLNKLLNEMDGLREDADILFLLTTNRPEALEAALASRPGRIDQAIEFPLPDESCREKLVRLYARGVLLSDEVVSAIVSRTDKVSAAFIKELMRRSVQFHLERDEAAAIEVTDVKNALDEMLFSGGSLNVKLLGGNAAAEGAEM